jgi:hypothetical protein
MGTEAVHRALVRFAQGELGKEIGPPNDVGFENFDWPTLGAVREGVHLAAFRPERVTTLPFPNPFPKASIEQELQKSA